MGEGYFLVDRDIKSENVLLTANLQVKLCDFGLSRSSLEVCGSLLSQRIRIFLRPISAVNILQQI